MKAVKRDKKFIGAAIGAVANIAGGIIGGAKRRRAERKARQANQRNIAQQAEVENADRANALSQMYADQEYVDEFKDKISLKNGGKVKGKDRIKIAKKYAMGGRSKKVYGTNTPIKQPDLNTENTSKENKAAINTANNQTSSFGSEAGDALGGVSSLVGSLFNKPSESIVNNRKQTAYSYNTSKGGLSKRSYNTDDNNNPLNSTTKDGVQSSVNIANNQYKDRLMTAKMGMRKRKK